MSKIKTQAETEALCRQAGFSATNARIAAAIAMCEAPAIVDGRICVDFGAVGDLNLQTDVWGPSYGGFQIRSLKEQTGTGGWRDAEALVRPLFNAKAARHIKRVQGWKAWSTYQSGMYKAYLQDLFPPPPFTYVVVAGDTLSGIGIKLGIDWRRIAELNHIGAPYPIYIGQNLKLPQS